MLGRLLLLLIAVPSFFLLYTKIIHIGQSEVRVEHEQASGEYDHISKNPKEIYLDIASEQGRNFSDIRRLMSRDLSNGKHLILMLKYYEKLNDNENASKVIALSKKLWPAYSTIRITAAEYWTKNTQLPSLLEEWNVILTRTKSSKTKNELFQALSTLALNSDYQKLLEPYALDPPKWWFGFFSSLAKHEHSTYLLNHFYSVRKNSSTPITEKERILFVDELIKKKYWSQAYFSWLSGLSNEELSLINAHIYDGSFEGKYQRPISSWSRSFKWRFTKNKNMTTSIDSTYGANGRKALHIHFRKRKRFNFHHVEQIINLSPGKYDVNYLSRLNNLNTPAGLEWKARCMEDSKDVLGKSKSYKGNQKWTEDSFSINVPEKCSSILLRLESSSHHAHNQVYLGHLWFDAFKITKDGG